MTPMLTLVCPVYKVRDYIAELIDSLIRGANHPEVEVIFVNDGTPDDSMALCRDTLERRRAEIRFRDQCLERATNGGQSAARNMALAQVSSRYVGFIDADDAVSDDYYETLRPLVAEGRCEIIEFGFVEFRGPAPKLQGTGAAVPAPSTQLSPFQHGFFAWSRVYRWDVVRDLRFPEGRLYEDVRYVAEAYGRASVIERIDRDLVLYRKRDGSTTAVRNQRYAEHMMSLVEGVAATLPSHRQPAGLLRLAAKRAAIILVKGFRIASRDERRMFFRACRAPLMQLRALNKHDLAGMGTRAYVFAALAITRCFASQEPQR